MTDNRTTELLQELSDLACDIHAAEIIDHVHITNRGWTFDSRWLDSWHAEFDRITDKLEQAIDATLGRPKVKKVRGLTYDEHGGEVYYLACSGCGDWVDGDLDCIGEYDGPNFCHNCGGEFDGPLMCKVCGELADMEFGDMCAECYWYEGEGNDER